MSAFEKNRHEANSHESMTRLPELANEVIRKNLTDELEKLKNAESWQRETGRSSETIVKYPEFRIVLIRMKPGSYMSHHRAEGPISVHAVLGRIRVHLPDDRMEELVPGDLLAIERGLEHDVEALEECAFLLTIAWPEDDGSRSCIKRVRRFERRWQESMAEVTIIVDGRKIQATSGSLLIDVCKRAGIEIPSFCYYPGLSLQGACRMCLVEIARTPKLQTACTTVVAEGMARHNGQPNGSAKPEGHAGVCSAESPSRLSGVRRRRSMRTSGCHIHLRSGRVAVGGHKESSR